MAGWDEFPQAEAKPQEESGWGAFPAAAAAPAPAAEPAPAPAPDPELVRADRIVQLADIMGELYDPDRKAAVLSISRKTGAPPDFVEGQFDFWKTQADQATSPQDFYERNPELAAIALDQPWVGKLVTRDKGLNTLQKLLSGYRTFVGLDQLDAEDTRLFGSPQFDGPNASFLRAIDPAKQIPGEIPGVSPPVKKETLEQGQVGQLEGMERVTGQWVTEPSKEDYVDPYTGEVYPAGTPTSRQVVPGIYQYRFNQALGNLDQGRAALQYASAVMDGGDGYEYRKRMLAARSRPQQDLQANPLEEVGLGVADLLGSEAISTGAMVLGTAVAGPFGTAAGITAGGAASAVTSWVQEFGNLGDFLEQRDDNGKLMDPQVAVGAAIAYATVASAVETGVNMGPWVKLIGPLGKEGVKADVKLFLKALGKDATKQEVLRRVAKQWGQAAVSEGLGEETIQGILSDAFGWYTRSRSAALTEDGVFKPQKAEPLQSIGDNLDVGAQVTVAAALVGAAPGVLKYRSSTRELERSTIAGRQLAAIVQAVPDSPTAVGAPEAFAAAVAAETASTGEKVTAAYIDPAGITRLAQEQNLDPVELVREVAGETGVQRYQEALATGEKMAVPMAEYVERWHQSGVAEALLPDTTTRSTGVMTPREAVENSKQIAEETKRLVAEAEALVEEPTPGEAMLQQMGQELAAAGKWKKSQVEPQVKVWRALLRREAEKNGLTVDEVAQSFAIRVADAHKDVAPLQALLAKEVQGAKQAAPAEPSAPALPAEQVRAQLDAEGREYTSFTDEDGTTTFASTGADGTPRLDRSAPKQDAEVEVGGALDSRSPSSETDPALQPSDIAAVREAAAPPASVLQAIRDETGIPVNDDGTVNAGDVAATIFTFEQTRDASEWLDTFEKNKHVQATYTPEGLADLRNGITMARQIMQRAIDQGILPEENFRDEDGKPLSPLRTNADFLRSFDLTTICPRQDTFTDTIHEVERRQEKLLSPEQRHLVGLMIKEAGAQPACWYCYGQAGRNAYDAVVSKVVRVAQMYVDLMRATDGKAKGKELEAIFQPASGEWKWNPRGKLADWLKANWEQLGAEGVTNEVKLRDLARGYVQGKTELEASFGAAARAFAQGATHANDPKGWASLKQQITKMRQAAVDIFNRRAGLRMNSQTDFRPWHIIEVSEAIASMFARKLLAHVYTKETDFLRIFGKTGIKFNLSALYVIEGGRVKLDNRGLPEFDPVMGMAGKDIEYWVQELPNDAGGMLVAVNDDALLLGLSDSRIHQIIPYHAGAVPGAVDKLEAARDYSSFQHETGWVTRTVEVPGKKKPDIEVKVQGEWHKKGAAVQVKVAGKTLTVYAGEPLDASHHLNDQDFYFKVCRDLGLTPKFGELELTDPKTGEKVRLLERDKHGGWSALHPEYMKLIRDTAREPGTQAVPDPSKINWPAAYEVEQRWIDAGGDKTDADPKLVEYVSGRIERGEWPVAASIPTEAEITATQKKVKAQKAKSAEQGLRVFAGEGSQGGTVGWMETVKAGAKRLIAISLTDRRDLSTFLHESAHAFWELKADLAEAPLRPEQRLDADLVKRKEKAKADVQAALDFMGVKDRAELTARAQAASAIRAAAAGRELTAEERAKVKDLVEPFERWARGFEAYLMEGKAPSLSLAGAFRTFSLWLRDVYRSLASLGVELTPEIRGVFDRMLATDAEIAAAAKQIGIDGPALEQAKTRAEVAALKEVQRATESWWKTALRKELEEAEKAFDRLPEVVAWRFLRRGLTTGVEGLKAFGEGVKLDYSAVVAVLGVEVAEAKFKGVLQKYNASTGEGGIHPDHLAAALGLESGQELLEDMAEMPDRKAWIESMADDQMAARFPGILEERARLKALVEKALHEEPSVVEELHRQWTEDRKKAGKKDGPPIESIKAAARIIVGRQLLQQLDPRRYFHAERAALKKRAAAEAKGDWAAAALASQQRLLNFYLYREALRAKEQLDQVQELAGKMLGEKGQERLGKASPIFRDFTLRLLEAVGLVTGVPAEVQAVGLTDLINDFKQPSTDLEPDFDTDVVGAFLANPRPFNDLTVTELEELDRALKQIRRAARDRSTVKVGNQRVSLDALVGDIKSEVSRLPARAALPEVTSQPNEGETGRTVMGFIDSATDPLTTFLDDDYLGPLARQALRDRYYAQRKVEHELLGLVAVKVAEALDGMSPEMRANLYAEVDRSMLPRFEGQRRAGKVDRTWMLLLLANLGNEGNMSRLLGGRDWTMEQVREFFQVNKLTAEEARFIQGLWTLNDKHLWPRIAAVHEAVNGTKPEKVQAAPLALTLADGTEITLTGGYWPAMADPKESELGKRQEDVTTAHEQNYDAFRATLLKGFTRRRASDASYVVRLDDFGAYPAHVLKVIRYIAYEEFVRDAGRILLRIQPDVEARLGESAFNQIDRWLKVVASGSPDSISKVEKELVRIIGFTVGRTVRTAMLLNIKNAMADLASPLLALVGPRNARVRPDYLLGATLEGVGGLVVPSSFGRGFWAMRQQALAESDELRLRADKKVREVRDQFDRFGAGGRRWRPLAKLGSQVEPGRIIDWVAHHGFIFQHVAEVLGTTLAWHAAKRQALARGASEMEARRRADDIIQKNWGSDLAAEKSALLRSRGAAGSLLMMQGFFNRMLSKSRQTVHPALVEWANAEGWKGKGKAALTASEQGAMLAGIWFITNVIGSLLEGRGPEEGEDDLQWLKRKMIAAPLTQVPLLNELTPFVEASVADDKVKGKLQFSASERASPLVSSAVRVLKSVGTLADGEREDSRRFWAAYEVAGFALGMPVSQVKRSGQYLDEYLSTPGAEFDPWKIVYGNNPRAPENIGDFMEDQP